MNTSENTERASWGRRPLPAGRLHSIGDRHSALPAGPSLLAYGMGRSYGDSCLNAPGWRLRGRDLDRFISFDPATGRLEAEAGVTLDEVLRLVVPSGWFPPVLPGTRFVTLGGAVANDVHGKNHHRMGSFGDHLEGFELLRSDGVYWCSARENTLLFRATIGGLGLTGLIRRVVLRLRRVASPAMMVETQRFADLDAFFALNRLAEARNEYAVAWVDCRAKGAALGRGIFISADHAPAGAEVQAPSRTLSFPLTPPLSLVNRLSLPLFNTLYYAKAPRHPRITRSHYLPFFFPLDSILNWNRAYGPRGFYQYQAVVPGADATRAMLAAIADSGQGSMLIVLKTFGNRPAPGMMSFPRAGVTLALDFPDRGDATLALFSRLDAIVREAGGAIYPAKDARMDGAMFRRSFPQWNEFASLIDPRFGSDLWRRVNQ